MRNAKNPSLSRKQLTVLFGNFNITADYRLLNPSHTVPFGKEFSHDHHDDPLRRRLLAG